ncbi:MAG: glycosyltransferase family A protein, partial [Candidatus Nanopelagicales bacterium]
GMGGSLEGHARWLSGLELWLKDHDRVIAQHNRRLDDLERARSVGVFMNWIEHARLTTSPKVSVILPTHNRAALLAKAIASVKAQSYSNWEIIVVDDASQDGTPEFLGTLDDSRIVVLRTIRGSACGSRNVGLDHVTGEITAYLDDDNIMHPLWLKAIVWGLEQRPDVDVVYGAHVVDDSKRINRESSGGLPEMYLEPYDRATLLIRNLSDMSAIAHRAGLPAARFDESLVEMGDWDLLCGLTADRDALMIPAIACFYSTDAPDRLSGGNTFQDDYDKVRRKHARNTGIKP